MAEVGAGSRKLRFSHPEVGELIVNTGADSISWGYGLNTQYFPTYGGEVVQILSCYVDDLQIKGTLRNYRDLEALYGYFLTYIKNASASGVRDERPITCEYPHRGWQFKIIVTSLPGYRKGRDVIAPEWQIVAHVIDHAGDVEDLKNLILEEAQIKAAINSPDNENFGLLGKIRFIDENPFSDPITSRGKSYKDDRYKSLDSIGDYYTKLLPSYLEGDFDAIFGEVGSRPAFDPRIGPDGQPVPKGTTDTDTRTPNDADKVIRPKNKIPTWGS